MMRIALAGNPNTGKSSVFNMLTGLRQHIGNFPGVTIDKRSGTVSFDGNDFEITDLPGTYSIYPRSEEEKVVYDIFTNKAHADYPDLTLVVADLSNLERNLFLFTQLYDLGLPLVLVLNMTDVAARKGISFDVEAFNKTFPGVAVVQTNAKARLGKDRILNTFKLEHTSPKAPFLTEGTLCSIEDKACQEVEAEKRYQRVKELFSELVSVNQIDSERFSVSPIDRILVHPVWGYLIFAFVLLIIFQFIFSFASYPMDWIDGSFASFSGILQENLPSGVFTDLLSQGIVPGIGGVLVFVPQIALLFFFISILEESGYLARVVFIMDRIMRPLGLNGKSVVPLLSSVACAIPGILSTRTISDQKERLITILIAPLMSCSARIPVYTLLITLVIPDDTIAGVFNLQGLVLFALYSLGLITALLLAFVLKNVLRRGERGFLLLELPPYKSPSWKNVGLTVWEKLKIFTVDAGKIILAISVVLWALASYGPSGKMDEAEKNVRFELTQTVKSEEIDQRVASARLENSFIGVMGKGIEPVISPLGYDWKLGISLITSFAAREVFVGSLATIYAAQSDESNTPLIERLKKEKRADGTPVYSLASGLSLMVFYVYAMQCMATLAVVKRETRSWKWPFFQIGIMGILAYVGAFIIYQIFR